MITLAAFCWCEWQAANSPTTSIDLNRSHQSINQIDTFWFSLRIFFWLAYTIQVHAITKKWFINRFIFWYYYWDGTWEKTLWQGMARSWHANERQDNANCIRHHGVILCFRTKGGFLKRYNQDFCPHFQEKHNNDDDAKRDERMTRERHDVTKTDS